MNGGAPITIPMIAAQKAELRRRMISVRDSIPVEEQVNRSLALVAMKDDPAFRAFLPAPGGVIATYWPIRSELNPNFLTSHLEGEGFRRALPRMTAEGLVFHAWWRDEDLVTGAFGVREPQPHWPIVVPDLILTPLVAFDARGSRLGYGKGFYDRAFAAHPRGRRVGIAYREQEVTEVPSEPHDLPLEAVFAV
ncbi:MAG: 5-formyltetrahydrofolate [Beijerinckiaceae bacterium]|nr:MAG: 5-formyltetrahydrofolate [Beijerinckiaceae bacterium]